MYDVILYAAIATIVCVMLYTVLGKSVGRGPEDDADLEKGLRQVTDLARLIGAELVRAETTGKVMRISVRYKAELASALVNADGETVEGDQDTLASINEIWTFMRKSGAADPNWMLADVEPSGGDDLEADPTPDTTA